MKKILFFPIWIGCLFLLASCHQNETAKETSDYTLSGDTILIAPKSKLANKLKTDVVAERAYRLQLQTAGTVKAIPTQYAEIAPPFSGRITKSYLRLGMHTTPETPLFEVSSPDFITAQKIFFQEKAQLQQAEKTLKRQEDLMAHGVGTQKDMEEAKTAYDVELKEYENAVIGIKIFKADPDRLVLGQPLVVRSPITGQVLENKVVLGQFIKNDASSVATVAELSKVWVAGQIKEKDIHFIHELDGCTIETAALPEKLIKGKVYHVNDMVDEDTRSVQVLIECNNTDRTLKPGMYVTVDFVNAPTQALLIPTSAVLQMNDESFVFVEAAPNKYVKRKIETANTDHDQVVIKSGLKPGDQIVTSGGFYLLDDK
jgi:cobalt-zinc-cadmium efflux system membrane fusion protein